MTQQHHYFATHALGWAVAETRQEAIEKLARAFASSIKPAIINCHKAAEPGWYVWTCQVAGEETAAYQIENFRPTGVEISKPQPHYITRITQKNVNYFSPGVEIGHLVRVLRAGIDSAADVVDRWESGDLAAAVNGIDGWADTAKRALDTE